MRAKDLYISESELLNEINMSPSNLRQLAGTINAMAGMEFEMIVPDVSIDDEDDFEPEPDYEYDESVSDIRDAVRFFDDGDHNSRRAIARLEESMRQDYEDWVFQHFDEYWLEHVHELVHDYLTLNANARDIVEILELSGGEAEEVLENDPTKQDYIAATEKVIDEMNSSSWYDEARDEAQGNYLSDTDREQEWLEYNGLNSMQDIAEHYDVNWPYWTEYEGGGGSNDFNDVADDFSRSIGRPVNASTSYHGATRQAGHYVVEPDGSLDADPGDYGLEFVSPPLPLKDMLADLQKVREWAKNRGCYTGKDYGTGLHINVSVPGYELNKLDYIKLALLLGDEYVLKQFGRMGNTYAKPAMEIIKRRVSEKPGDAQALLNQMREHLSLAASKAIHSGSTDKYTSINTKSGYIEFRSPGGDWLNEHFDKIENTLMRFAVAMDAAIDPNKYREEYLKKLYKLLGPKNNKDTIAYFAQYVAGEIPKAALRSFIKQAQLERKVAKNPTGGQPYWWRVSNPQHSHGEIEVVAKTKEEAIEKALLPDGYPSWARTRALIQAVPVRPYDASPLKATVGEPQAIGQRSGPTVGGRPSNPAGRWVITPEADRRNVVYRFNAAGYDDANVVRRQWAQEHPGVWLVQRDDNQTLGQPTSSSRNSLSQSEMERRLDLPDQTGDANYEIIDRRTGRRVFVMIANTEYDARRKYADWLSAAGYPIETEDYGFREIALPGSTLDLQRRRAAISDNDLFRGFENHGGDLTPRGPGPWEIYRISNGETVRELSNTNRGAAESEARYALGLRAEAPELYGVRTRQSATQAPGEDGQEYRIVNMRDRSQLTGFRAANQAAAEREAVQIIADLNLDPDNYDVVPLASLRQPAPQPLGAGRELVGWDILIDGQPVHRISGIGNNQGDANRHAQQWILSQGSSFLRQHQGGEVQVVPAWREA